MKQLKYILLIALALTIPLLTSAQSTSEEEQIAEQIEQLKAQKKKARLNKKKASKQSKAERAKIDAAKKKADNQTKKSLAKTKKSESKKKKELARSEKKIKSDAKALARNQKKEATKFKGQKTNQSTAKANDKIDAKTFKESAPKSLRTKNNNPAPRKPKNTASEEATIIYNDFGYKASIETFLQKKKELTTQDKARVANAYRLNHDIDNAAIWYAKIADKSNNPKHKLQYAQVLQSKGQNKLASKYYQAYSDALKDDSGWDNIASMFSKNVLDNNRFIDHDITMTNEKNINSSSIEYSPALFEDGIIFVSTHKPSKFPSIGKDPWIKENFMSLYKAERGDDGLLKKADAFSYDITTKYHEGPVTFSRGDNRIFFTRNHFNDFKRTNNSAGIMKLQIYTSYRDGESWSTPEEVEFNTDEYEECHPSLTPDGSKLYFSSDRKGGYGGMDLYVSQFSEGEWGEPTNLGPSVNTAGNEVFPFIHENGMLFYASNGHDGLGGLDVFYSRSTDDNWSKAKNVGTPFNSKKDDFGFVINADGSKGYLTSARSGGNGKDDIYSFDLEDNIFNRGVITICTFDEETGERIGLVNVNTDGNGTYGSSLDELYLKVVPTEKEDEYKLRLRSPEEQHHESDFQTDDHGEFQQTVNYDKPYNYIAHIDGYENGSLNFTPTPSISEYCIPLKKKKTCLQFNGDVRTSNSRSAVPFAQLTLTDSEGIVKEITADANGIFDFGCIPCDEQFTVKAAKGGKNASTLISTMDIECDPNNNVNKTILLEEDKVFAVGEVIVLENIFYDFDKYYIRSDAKPDLDKVVSLMLQYPSMVIELGSHTDARGRKKYNERLSSNRAKSAVEYIVSRGIDNRRIVAQGYGETTPRNQCVDGVTCSEEEHQYNRRTEVKVLSIGRNDVDIRYNDNRPEYIDRAPVNKRIDKKIENN